MWKLTEKKDGGGVSEVVAVMMATFNGERFLSQQIDSLESQTVPRVDLWVSDDGSEDGTGFLLEKALTSWKKGYIEIVSGPKKGFVENFRSLITNPRIEADYYAFCDQDDIWDPDKLAVAVEWLSTQPEGTPALYCSRTRSISETGKTIGLSPLFTKKPSFKNAIVQSIAGANTMVMNRVARNIVAKASARTSFVSHDWWCYLLISGAGGRIYYSPNAKISYRQHSQNLVGENRSLRARFNRLVRLVRGGYLDWNSRNIESLFKCQDLLSDEASDTIRLVCNCRTTSLFRRVEALFRSGIYRQSFVDQVALIFACAFKRL